MLDFVFEIQLRAQTISIHTKCIFSSVNKFQMCRFMYTVCYKNEKKYKNKLLYETDCTIFIYKNFQRTLLISFTFSDSLGHCEICKDISAMRIGWFNRPITIPHYVIAGDS